MFPEVEESAHPIDSLKVPEISRAASSVSKKSIVVEDLENDYTHASKRVQPLNASLKSEEEINFISSIMSPINIVPSSEEMPAIDPIDVINGEHDNDICNSDLFLSFFIHSYDTGPLTRSQAKALVDIGKQQFVGRKIRKKFGMKIYAGTVQGIEEESNDADANGDEDEACEITKEKTDLYHVLYEDGGEEKMSLDELLTVLEALPDIQVMFNEKYYPVTAIFDFGSGQKQVFWENESEPTLFSTGSPMKTRALVTATDKGKLQFRGRKIETKIGSKMHVGRVDRIYKESETDMYMYHVVYEDGATYDMYLDDLLQVLEPKFEVMFEGRFRRVAAILEGESEEKEVFWEGGGAPTIFKASVSPMNIRSIYADASAAV